MELPKVAEVGRAITDSLEVVDVQFDISRTGHGKQVQNLDQISHC